MANHRVEILALLALSAVLFFINTWGYDLWPADEPRFGEIPREMMQSGDYLVPRCNGEPYKEKPPLLFWSIVLASWPFGDVTEFSARAPSGLAALITVWLTYVLAARLYNRRVALWSALALMTMLLFWWEARSVRTDMLLTATMTGALVAFWRWHEQRQTRWLLALYAAVAVGLFTKGPPALVFPVLLIVVFYWKRKGDRRKTHWLAGLLIATAPVLVWFIAARMAIPAPPTQAAKAGMAAELHHQIIGRLFMGVSKAEAPWYYLWNVPVWMFPWTLFLPWVVRWTWQRRREDERMRLLLAWTVPAFVFFSISIGKRDVYLLPIYPALAILTARSMLELMEGQHARWRKRTAVACGMALVLAGAAPFAVLVTEYRDVWSVTFILFSLVAILGGMATLITAASAEARSLHKTVVRHGVVLAVLAVLFIFPALNPYKGASAICRPLRELSQAGTEYRLYCVGFSREEYVFYSRHFHSAVLTDLLSVELSHAVDEATMAKSQSTLRKSIAKAVDKVPVTSPAAPTETELPALLAAIHTAIQETKVDPELARAFETALKETVQQFASEFEGPLRAFMFVQEEDWKWLIPLFPQLRSHYVIGRQSVGKRNMLLIANEAGMKATKELRTLLQTGARLCGVMDSITMPRSRVSPTTGPTMLRSLPPSAHQCA
jgi:4-amino-4-deoxy-L-arabinose transferase-like glycosyltransferase